MEEQFYITPKTAKGVLKDRLIWLEYTALTGMAPPALGRKGFEGAGTVSVYSTLCPALAQVKRQKISDDQAALKCVVEEAAVVPKVKPPTPVGPAEYAMVSLRKQIFNKLSYKTIAQVPLL